MAKAKVGIAHCPSSNLRLGSGVAPVRKISRRGHSGWIGRGWLSVQRYFRHAGRSPASDARSSREVRRLVDACEASAAYGHPRRRRRRYRDDIGQIAAGKAADLAIFDVNRLDYAGSVGDPVASLLFCGVGHRAKWTIVNGRIVVENGILKNLDEGETTRKANAACLDLLRKAGAISK